MSRLPLYIGFLKSLGVLPGCVEVPQYDPVRLQEESPPPPPPPPPSEPVCTVDQDVYIFHSFSRNNPSVSVDINYHVQHASHFTSYEGEETSLGGKVEEVQKVSIQIDRIVESAIYSATASLLLGDGSRVDQACPPVSVFIFDSVSGKSILNVGFPFHVVLHDSNRIIKKCEMVFKDRQGHVIAGGRRVADQDDNNPEKWVTVVRVDSLPLRSDFRWRFECTNSEGAIGASDYHGVTTSDEGLVGWYRFDAEDNLGLDSSGNSNHGVVYGDPRFTRGENIAGGAIVMDGDLEDESGEDDYIVISENDQINPRGQITLEARFLVIEEIPKSHTILWGGAGNGAQDGGGWSMNTENPPNGGDCYINPTNVPSNIVGSSNLRLNQYNHVVCTYDGAYAKFFLNGNEEGSKRTQGSLGNNQKMIIGYGNNGYFRGQIDEVAIYNRALSQKEIEDSFKRLKKP